MPEKTLIVHGGAGESKDKKQNRRIQEIYNKGKQILEKTNDSEETVEKTVNLLEQDPIYNAGYGSKLQLDGKPRPESGIMTSDLKFGSAIGLEGIDKPISVSRIIKNDLNNNIIGSPYSTYLALQNGLEIRDLTTDKRIEEWLELKKEISGLTSRDLQKRLKKEDKDSGTVGCVAVDSRGRLAAGTSTGGRTFQTGGRIGDSPIPGAGYYCNEEIAISTTGVGEAILKSQLAHRISIKYKDKTLKKAVEESLDYLSENTKGFAGVIVVTSSGESYSSYNSGDMCYYKE